ncbi:putative sodium-coupled neutral amino acid transporter 11 isoform X2 [Denticeps clupeoides]|uniref:putative sodium-coupled neutral amino acid transporter 11 isoform X2 n=1 Tax=Denticeps clupeoides TaxID=299321 RepID=UPI0010A31505|nr:putative sodium-coupled neutral amino acid transporter 11 isoform X2 [Denticeps clupeoides]
MENGTPDKRMQPIDVDDRKALLPTRAEDAAGKGSMTSASFNFINSIIGSGIIGLPYSLNQAGLPLGLILLMAVAFITDYSIILLIRGGNLSGTDSYQSLVHSTFGFAGYIVLSILQFLYPFIAMISYNIITGDTLTKVFLRIPGVGPDNMFAERHFVILASTVLFTLPLSLYRNIEKLGKVSLVSMVLTLVIIVIVIVRAATLGPHIPPTENAWGFARWNAIQAVGVMSFAFICHHNSFLIYGSLREPTLGNWTRVTHLSVGLAVLLSAVFAVAGYVTFTGYTQGDIFENYCRNDDLATFARFCYGISIVTTFPLECFVTREGVLSATPLMFIIPSACFLKLSPGRWFHGENIIVSAILLVGVFVMVVGLTMTVMYPQDCSHGAELFYCLSSNLSIVATTPSSMVLQLQNSTQNVL